MSSDQFILATYNRLTKPSCYKGTENNKVVYIKIHGYYPLDFNWVCSLIVGTPTLKTLDLRCNEIKKLDIYKLFKVISQNKTIRKLYIEKCSNRLLTTKELDSLFDAYIHKNTSIRELYMSDKYDDKYMAQLCEEFTERNHQWKYTKMDVTNVVLALHWLPYYIIIEICELLLYREGKKSYASHYEIAKHVIHIKDFIKKILLRK